MGLVIVGALAIYLLIAIAVVIGAVKYAKKSGKSAKRWGWSAALVMYLIPFWDWMPTVLVHQYYCATEAGFWVYKTPEQWKKENPGVVDTLVAKPISVPDRIERNDEDNWTLFFNLNNRIDLTNSHAGPLPFYRWRTESALIDSQSGIVLVKSIDFYTAQIRAGGGWKGWKFWLAIDHCPRYSENSRDFGAYRAIFKGASK